MRFKKSSLYYIRFYDHCIGEKEMECEVCGWVINETKIKVTISYWNVVNKLWRENNNEPVTILKSCILEKRKIKDG